MKRHSAAFALGYLAVIMPGQGAEPVAPLESSKQGLRKLESGQTGSRGPEAKEGLRAETPGLSIPGQESLPLPVLMTPDKQEKQRKTEKERAESQNWLVNGVRRLEAADKRAALEPSQKEAAEAGAAMESAPSDTTDPQYLLRIYDEQKKVEEGRQNVAAGTRKPVADPLAPFLQGWLGNSPSRGPAFDDFVRGRSSGSPGQPIGVTAPGQPLTTDTTGAASPATSEPAQLPSGPNPYLDNSSAMGIGLDALNRPLHTAPPAQLPSLAAGPQPSVSVAPLTPVPELRPAERKAPPPPQADDKKYFPQLNKF
jgi:hypothetical protein